jgi:hypothetical protein
VGVKEQEIEAAAMRVFRTRQAAMAFLTLPCPALGAVPSQLAQSGREDEVLAFLDRLEREAPAPAATLDKIFSGWLGRFGRRR